MENKDKIKQSRFQISQLKEHLKGAESDFKKEILSRIDEHESQINKIIEVGNGDGTGRKPISKSSHYA